MRLRPERQTLVDGKDCVHSWPRTRSSYLSRRRQWHSLGSRRDRQRQLLVTAELRYVVLFLASLFHVGLSVSIQVSGRGEINVVRVSGRVGFPMSGGQRASPDVMRPEATEMTSSPTDSRSTVAKTSPPSGAKRRATPTAGTPDRLCIPSEAPCQFPREAPSQSHPRKTAVHRACASYSNRELFHHLKSRVSKVRMRQLQTVTPWYLREEVQSDTDAGALAQNKAVAKLCRMIEHPRARKESNLLLPVKCSEPDENRFPHRLFTSECVSGSKVLHQQLMAVTVLKRGKRATGKVNQCWKTKDEPVTRTICVWEFKAVT